MNNTQREALDKIYDAGFSQRQVDRMIDACIDAIGERLTIRTSPRTTTSGVIVDAWPSGVRYRGRSVVMQFRVVMECGEAKARREFTIEKLPA